MCYNCGCFNPQDTMGNDDNITETTLAALAKKRGKNLPEFKKEVLGSLKNNELDKDPELKETFAKASKAWGQSIEDASKNAQDLLEQEA